MAQICCCNSGPPTLENVLRSLNRLDNSINSSATGSAGQGQDPSCECDPCTCPSDTVPCNANALTDGFSNKGLLKKFSGLVRKARQIQATQGDGCVCADRPPYVGRIPAPTPQPPTPQPPTPQPPSLEQPSSGPGLLAWLPHGAPRRDGPLGFFDLPAEIRNMIYEYYFEGLEPIRRIAAVRFRQGEQRVQTRLLRNYQPRNRPWRRRIDPARLTEDRPFTATGRDEVPIWIRETATFTYEPAASDEDLQRLADNRLGLVNTNNRQLSEEAGSVFYAQNFHFTLPREVNRIEADQGMYHSILAAEAFLRHRRWSWPYIRALGFDLWQTWVPRNREEDFDGEIFEAYPEDSMPQEPQEGNWLQWTNGLGRLGRLVRTLNDLPNFQHLRLNFRNRAPPWYTRGIHDPTHREVAFEFPAWGILFNIGRRDRLSIHMDFQYRIYNAADERVEINDALYFIRILRDRLLTNAEVRGLRYEGIRVRGWDFTHGTQQLRIVIIESDHEWLRGYHQQRHQSHLVPLDQLGEADYQEAGFDRPHDWAFMAQEDPPAELPPRVPTPPPPQPTWWQKRARLPKSALDDSDDENA